MKQVMHQVSMHCIYITIEALTKAQITITCVICIFKLQVTQISTVTVASQYITGLTL